MIDINTMTMRQYLAINKAMYYATAAKDFHSIEDKAVEAMKYISRGRADQAHNEMQSILFACQMLKEGESPFVDILEAFIKRDDILDMTHKDFYAETSKN